MRKFLSVLLAASVIVSSLAFAKPTVVAAAGNNLIANPSVETANPTDPTTPQSWNQGFLWGNLDATYSYPTIGQDGTRSIKVQITRFVSGDAKWYFNPVAVTPNTTYTFTDQYQASATTDLVAAFADAAGNTTYQDLGNQAASAAWKQAVAAVTAPATAQTLTIFHTLSAVGSLQTDNFSLTAQAPDTGLIPNASFENVTPGNPNLPASWFTSSWGTNTAKFQYLNTGHTGTRSVKLTVSRYTDGDAKWYYNPVNVTPGGTYTFSDYYQSNIPTRVVVWIVNQDGTDQYLGLRMASITSTGVWAKYSDSFVVPPEAKSATVFHLLNANGSLTLDDYSLVPSAMTGFNQGMVSLTFDDGYEANAHTVLPVLQQDGLVSTGYYISGFLNTPDYQTADEVKQFQAAGNEIGSHTVTHPDLTTLSASQLTTELKQSQQTLQTLFGVPVTDFASPYGTYNDKVLTQAKKYYQSFRNVDDGYNSRDNFDPYRLKVQNVNLTTTPAQVANWIATAKAQNLWLILVYHKVDTQNLSDFDSTVDQFTQEMQALKASAMPVLTIHQALGLAK